jgi:imidazolonepropionase-like amidohydrolase
MFKNLLKAFLCSIAIALSMSLHAEEETEEKEEVVKTQWLVVHAGSLLAVPGEKPASERTIVVKDGLIDGVLDGFQSPAEIIEEDENAEIEFLDLSDSYVLPGLMDMHVHLSFEFDVKGQQSYGAADAYMKQEASARDEAYNFVNAISNARKTLHAGYTTVRDLGSRGWHIFALRDAIRDGNLEGPRIFAAGHAVRVGADEGSGACVSVESCRRATREQIDMGADVIKVYATCSGSKPCGYQSAPSVFLADELRAVVETAGTRELKVAAHAHGTGGINLAAASGVSSIDHGSYNDAESHKIMRKNDVFLVSTMAVQPRILKDIKTAKGPMLDVMQGFLDNHGPRMYAAHKAGVQLAAGSDAGVSPHGKNAYELEMYVKYGLTPAEAIKTATVNGARLLGMEDKLGTIEAGKIADLIAVEEDPLEDIKVLQDVAVVIKDGRIVKQ